MDDVGDAPPCPFTMRFSAAEVPRGLSKLPTALTHYADARWISAEIIIGLGTIQSIPIIANSKRIHKFHHVLAPLLPAMKAESLVATLPVAPTLVNSDIQVCMPFQEFERILSPRQNVLRVYSVRWSPWNTEMMPQTGYQRLNSWPFRLVHMYVMIFH